MLTKSQEEALRLIKDWLSAKGKLFKLGGPAGSGKSFLIPEILNMITGRVIIMTPTGKAALVLQKSGIAAATIHSTIYQYVEEEDNEESESPDDYAEEDDDIIEGVASEDDEPHELKFILRDRLFFRGVSVFIIDEGSMVGSKLLEDILSFDIPVLMVGDPNQLPPVDDKPIFLTCDYYLTEIVRQAQDSPIIWLSQQVLQGRINPGWYGNCCVRYNEPSDDELLYADVVLADTNNDRKFLNTKIRNLKLGADGSNIKARWLVPGDVVICRDNDFALKSTLDFPLTNGTMGTVREIHHCNLRDAKFELLNLDTGCYVINGTRYPWMHKKDKRSEKPKTIEYGYALTVHLSQGSEWGNVIYTAGIMVNKRSLYTAITRAKESVLITLGGLSK